MPDWGKGWWWASWYSEVPKGTFQGALGWVHPPTPSPGESNTNTRIQEV